MSGDCPWCPACGSRVIWEGPPEHCLECGSVEVSREEQSDDDGPAADGRTLIRDSYRFLEAVYELQRHQAAKGGKP
jgi:hypothetical protein